MGQGQTADEILVAIRADNSELKAKLSEVVSSLNKTANESKSSANTIKNAFKGVGAYILAQISVDAIKGMVKLAGEIDTVKTSFNNLTASIKGGGKGLLDALKIASAGTVSELDMMKSSNLAIQLMGEQVADKLPKMMEIARAAARSKGTEVSQMFDDIIVASGRQSVMILDNLGISSATAGRYQDEYAMSLGKTREQLNATQKSQAFFYAVMKAGKEFISTAGIETLTLGEKMQVMEARGEDAAGMLAEKMIPGLNELMNTLGDANGKDKSVFVWLGDQVNDLLVLLSRLILNLKSIPLIWGRFKKDIGVAISGSESERKQLGQRADYDKEIENLQTANEKLAYLQKNKKKLLESGYTEEEINYTVKMNEKVNAYSWNRTPSNSNTKPNKKIESSETKQAIKKSEYFSFLGEGYEFEAQAAKLNEQWIELKDKYGMTMDQRAQIDKAYYKKLEELRMQDGLKQMENFTKALSLGTQLTQGLSELNSMASNKANIEIENDYNKRKEVIEQSKMDEKQKADALAALEKETEQKRKEGKRKAAQDTKSLNIAEAGLAIPTLAINAFKSMSGIPYVGVPLGIAAGIAAAAFGAAKLAMIISTPIPEFSRGTVPFNNPNIGNNNHFLAAIGSNEAVMNARATAANADILQAMNQSGERYQGNESTIVHTVVQVDGKILTEITDKHRADKAFNAGLGNYASRSVY